MGKFGIQEIDQLLQQGPIATLNRRFSSKLPDRSIDIFQPVLTRLPLFIESRKYVLCRQFDLCLRG